MPDALRKMQVRELLTEYTGEAKQDETLTLCTRQTDRSFLMSGSAQKRLFRLELQYEETATKKV